MTKLTEATVEFTGDKSRFDTAAKGIQGQLKQLAGLAVRLAPVIGLGAIARTVVRNSIAYQDAMAQLEARLKSTGGVSGQTMQSLDQMAQALQRTTTFGDEATKQAQSLLLTFKQIRGDTFEAATRSSLDLATALGTDLRSAALQVGKALEDPSTQMSMLRRSGISFTQEQIEMARAMQRSGDIAGAQAIVLGELQTQFGGAAEAARGTLGGALKFLQNQWGDLFEVSSGSSAGIIAAINSMGEAIPAVRDVIGKFLGGIQLLAVDAAVGVSKLRLAWERVKAVFGGSGSGVAEAEQALQNMRDAAEEVRNEIIGLGQGEAPKTFPRLATDLDAATEATDELTDAQMRLRRVLEAQVRTPGAGLSDAMLPGGFAPDAAEQQWREAQQRISDGFITIFDDLKPHTQEFADEIEDAGKSFGDKIKNALSGGGGGIKGLLGSFAGGLGLGGPFGGVLSVALGGGLKDAVGSVLGSVGKLVGGLFGASKEAEEAARRMQEATDNFIQSMTDATASLNASGTADEWIEGVRQQTNAWRKALEEATGIDVGSPFSTELVDQFGVEGMIQAILKLRNQFRAGTDEFDAINAVFERLLATVNKRVRAETQDATKAMEEAARAAEELAASARQLRNDLAVRGLNALGRSTEAQRLGMRFSQNRELEQAVRDGVSDADLDFLRGIQGIEREAFELGVMLDEQTAAIEAFAEAELQALDDQRRVLEDQLSVAQSAEQAQRQMVESLRATVTRLDDFLNGIRLSNLSPLSPRARLDEARSQFQALANLARGGDVTAAQSLPDAGRALLEASREFFASSSGFVMDFDTVEATLEQIRDQFTGRLSVEERILRELEAQTVRLQEQIAAVEAQAAQVQRSADAQIAALQAAHNGEMDRLYDLLVQIMRTNEILTIRLPRTDTDPPPPPPIFDLPIAATVEASQAAVASQIEQQNMLMVRTSEQQIEETRQLRAAVTNLGNQARLGLEVGL